MGSQVNRENYLAALEVAHSQLDEIIREFDGLQLRKEQIENAVGALEPFLRFAQPANHEVRQTEPVRHEFRQPEAIHIEPAQEAQELEIFQPVHRAVPMPAPAPIAPPAFSPVSDSNLDPIQNRINHALGLAVA
jgi:hypothetical protein